MRKTSSLIGLELKRSLNHPATYGLALAYFIVQAIYFAMIVDFLVQPIPMTVSPLRYIYSGGFSLLCLSLVIPALSMRIYAEERSRGTWDRLATMGAGSFRLVCSRFVSLNMQLLTWQILTLTFPFLLSFYSDVDWAVVLTGWLGLVLTGMLWSSISLCLGCRTPSVVLSYILSCLGIVVLWRLTPLFRGAFAHSTLRPLIESLSVEDILGRMSQGYLDLSDILFFIGGILLFILLQVHFLESEKRSRPLWVQTCLSMMISSMGAFAIFLILFIARSHHIGWNLSLVHQNKLSKEYVDILKEFPKGGELIVLLPGSSQATEFYQARDLILAMAEKTTRTHGDMKLKVLDPDLDLLEMESLRKSHSIPNNNIGGLILRLGDKSLSIPYHQLLSLKNIHVGDESRRSIEFFHGEEQLASAFRVLSKKGESTKALVIKGSGELDLSDSGRSGGSSFLSLLSSMGIQVIQHHPGVDPEANLENIDLVLWLDPKSNSTNAMKKLLASLLKSDTPLLACKSASVQPAGERLNWNGLQMYGVRTTGHVVVQDVSRQLDPFAFAISEISNHSLLKGLNDNTLIFHMAECLEEGIASDPRIQVTPLLRTAKHQKIWGDSDPSIFSRKKIELPNQEDLTSPLNVAYVSEKHSREGITPLLVFLGSAAPFENRFIQEGANRTLVFKCVDYLLHPSKKSALPPKKPQHFNLKLTSFQAKQVQALALLGIPFILLILGFRVWWRR